MTPELGFGNKPNISPHMELIMAVITQALQDAKGMPIVNKTICIEGKFSVIKAPNLVRENALWFLTDPSSTLRIYLSFFDIDINYFRTKVKKYLDNSAKFGSTIAFEEIEK